MLRHIHAMLDVICNRFQITDRLADVTKNNMELIKTLALKIDRLEGDIVKQLKEQVIKDTTENERLREKIRKLQEENKKQKLADRKKFEAAKRLDTTDEDNVFLCMPARAANCLKAEGIKTKEQLFEYLRVTPKHQMLRVHNLGSKSYNDIIYAAMLHGFKEYMEQKKFA